MECLCPALFVLRRRAVAAGGLERVPSPDAAALAPLDSAARKSCRLSGPSLAN